MLTFIYDPHTNQVQLVHNYRRGKYLCNYSSYSRIDSNIRYDLEVWETASGSRDKIFIEVETVRYGVVEDTYLKDLLEVKNIIANNYHSIKKAKTI